jgi:hypothetical protein
MTRTTPRTINVRFFLWKKLLFSAIVVSLPVLARVRRPIVYYGGLRIKFLGFADCLKMAKLIR